MRDYGPGRPLVFNHIPKTAGTSLGAALHQVLQPAISVQGIDTSLFGGYDNVESIRPTMRSYVFLSPDELPPDATLVAGHLSPATTAARYPGADHVTVLRVPQVRVLSQWLHSRGITELSLRHWGPAGDAFRAGWLSLHSYLQHAAVAPSTDNTMTRFLAFPHPLLARQEFIAERDDEELYEAARARLDSFAHVDVVENKDFLREFGTWLGADLPAAQLNERTAVPPRRRPDLAAELDNQTRALLDHRHRIDVRLWSDVARRAMPGVVPEELLEATMGKAVDRYATMLERPYQVGPVRKLAEYVFDVRARLLRPALQ